MKYLVLSLLMFSSAEAQTIAASQVVLLAKAAVFSEVEFFNAGLASEGRVEGYNPRLTQYLIKSGKTSIDAEYMLSKCTLSEENIGALLSDTLSREDEALASRKNGLASVKGTYNGKVWRLLSEICVRARDHFVERLQVATENGVDLAFKDQTVNETAQILFYPTDFGRATFGKSVSQAFNTLLNGAMVFGAGNAILGIPVGGLVLGVVTFINGVKMTAAQVSAQNPFLKKLRSDELNQFKEIKIDLSPTELKLI